MNFLNKYKNRTTISFDDDIVIVFDENGEVIYKGMEDYEPMKNEDWIWDRKSKSYKLDKYTKICID